MASVLQVATIKDQGGNNNAIEIANTSANVTINNLTSSTGFPAGHVLQTVTQTASTSSDTTTSAEVPNISGASGSFEKQINITSGNKVLVHMSAIVSFVHQNHIDVGGAVGIYVTQGGSTTAVYDQTGALGQYLYLNQNEDFNVYEQIHLSVLHTPSVTNPTYKPYLRPYMSSTLRLRCSGDSPFIITLQEIQA